MIVSLLVAMTKNRVIGFRNKMPWHLPADLRRFKSLTMGKTIVMGRKTFESIGKPLPGRRNVVITRQNKAIEGCVVYSSVSDALDHLQGEEEVFVIGGGELYRQTLSFANRLYLTLIDIEREGDTFFPTWDEQAWRKTFEEFHSPDAQNPFSYQFIVFERNVLPHN